MSRILHGDSLEVLKKLGSDSVDAVITDPPYGYSFMGKDWDKAVPSVEIWEECLRVLKPGAFAMVMSAPRSDVQNAMISRLMEAGFRLDFTPIYWTYASGFPKAGNIGKMVDKRLGAERKFVAENPWAFKGDPGTSFKNDGRKNPQSSGHNPITAASSEEAKVLDGSYAGFQPKPAVEVIIVAMKPLTEKTYVDQALKNGHGITWLDDARIPTSEVWKSHPSPDIRGGKYGGSDGRSHPTSIAKAHEAGRFPANLLVSDDVLNDGSITVSKKQRIQVKGRSGGILGKQGTDRDYIGGVNDSGSYSRYFDLDKWAQTLPFLIVPKASKREKSSGLEAAGLKAVHPTVKPLKLMSYLVALTTRKGDTVLDPFVGSGTTVIAAEKLERYGIGIEREAEYVDIARARLGDSKNSITQIELL